MSMGSTAVPVPRPPAAARPRVLVLGAGKMGLLHGALLNATGRADVAGLVDLDLQARLVPRAMGLPVKTYPSLERALAQAGRVDAVLVCTPPRSHHPVAKAALAAGAHVFVEKPLTTSPEASRELADIQEKAGKVGLVGYVRRHHAVYQEMRRVLSGKALRSLEVRILSPQFADAPTSGVHRGGLEWDLLPHASDMLLWLLGGPRARTLEGSEGDGASRVRVHGRAGDTAFALEADWACREVRKVEMRVEAHLADGTALSCNEDMLFQEAPGGAKTQIFHRRAAPAPWFDLAGHEFSMQTLDLLDALAGKPSTGATFRESLWTDQLVHDSVALARGAAP